MYTTTARPRATAFEAPTPNHRADFAWQAAIEAFGPKAIHHLIRPDFVDHGPVDELHGVDEAVDGIQAVSRWLSLAANLEGEEAEIAYQTADEIRRVLGLSQNDVTQRTAA